MAKHEIDPTGDPTQEGQERAIFVDVNTATLVVKQGGSVEEVSLPSSDGRPETMYRVTELPQD